MTVGLAYTLSDWRQQLLTDARALGIMFAPLTGPDAAPAEVFAAENIQRILGLA